MNIPSWKAKAVLVGVDIVEYRRYLLICLKGPVTAKGKARSSQNALKHGMRSAENREVERLIAQPNYVQARVHRFIEYSKLLIDKLTAWHYSTSFSGRPTGQMEEVDGFTRSAHSMHYYDSVLVIEKRLIDEPRVRRTGQPSF